jgi:hypothetical protein
MWAGGLLIGLGGLLALSPGRRRRATDPASGAPIEVAEPVEPEEEPMGLLEDGIEPAPRGVEPVGTGR